ncbi:MAG: recombinase family protein [Firmicutes bacterium]|nr:recombinase family protein [Bacillota bacterium]
MARKSRKHLQNIPEEQKSSITEIKYIAGIYTRTSSQEQNEDSIENQKSITERYIQENSDIELRKVYVDYGISSFSRFRPGFDEMLLDIELKFINCILVKDISRFSRDYLEAGDYLQRKFPLWGVRFISVTDNFDSLRSDATQLKIALWSLLSYQYSIDLSKKIQEVISHKQATGTYIPAKLPYGYKKVYSKQGTEWALDEQTAPIVQQLFLDVLSGLSAFAVASNLNKQKVPAPSSEFWSSGSIIRVLKNMTYIGTLVTRKTQNNIIAGRRTIHLPPEDWIRHIGHHDPIIDEKTYYAVQQVLSQRHSFTSRQSQPEDFFCGKLYCGICGRKMRLKRSGNGSIYYICPRRDEAGASCANKARSEVKLKRQVFLVLAKRIDELRICYQDTIAYEKSPYYLRKTGEQAMTIQAYEQELERQFQVFKRLYEESIIKHTIRSADIQGLLRHLLRVRTTLQERHASIVKTRDEYWDKEIFKRKKISAMPDIL